MALYGVREAWELTGAGGAVTGLGGAVTGAVGAVTGAGGTGAITVGEDLSLAVTTVLARFVVEPPP